LNVEELLPAPPLAFDAVSVAISALGLKNADDRFLDWICCNEV
jgi:hypothetical protein